jgi:hypothetical protein
MFVTGPASDGAPAAAKALITMNLQEFADFLAVSRDSARNASAANLRAAVEHALKNEPPE